MYNGIGLKTVRGSGTNGYVTTNKSFIKMVRPIKLSLPLPQTPPLTFFHFTQLLNLI